MQFVPIDAEVFPNDNIDYFYRTQAIELHSLLIGYLNGFFPWYRSGEPVRYYHPAQRAVLNPTQFHCSHSLRKSMQQAGFSCAVDTDFEQVIAQCAKCHTDRHGATWITDELRHAFCMLHALGLAHSVEVYVDGILRGGLYGLMLGSLFCGESMFYTATNASKLALYTLCTIAPYHNITLIDCQLPTPHLQSLGATTISRADFLQRLHDSLHRPTQVGTWQGSMTTAQSINSVQLLSMVQQAANGNGDEPPVHLPPHS